MTGCLTLGQLTAHKIKLIGLRKVSSGQGKAALYSDSQLTLNERKILSIDKQL